MHEPAFPAQRKQHAHSTAIALTLVLACYACARVLEVIPTSLPRTAIVALDVLSAMAFALVDGARNYRLRGILVFAAICIVGGNLVENLGVTTGFPFGRYYFVNLMGPKLFQVPVLLGLAYIGMAYVSWMLGRAILGQWANSDASARIFVLPLLAGLIMTAWDLAQDPVWATALHGWIWIEGGPWFGVPISNYLGWYGTVLIIFLLFALYLRRYPAVPAAPENFRPAMLFYALCALGNVLQILPAPVPAVVQDPTGRAWRVANITAASALVSVFVMGTFVLLALVRQRRTEKALKD